MKLSIIMPVYNEKNTVCEIVKKVLAVNLGYIDKELIIVDDNSCDGTKEILKTEIAKLEKVKIIYKNKNRGKTSALKTGFKYASGDLIIIQDADLEYDPNDYPRLLKPILEGKADVVYGTRFLGEEHRVLFFWHSLGNKFLTFLSNAFTNLNLTDMETCYKVFKSEVIKNIKIKSTRFGFEPEITAKIAKMKYRIYEVPISYYGRDYSEGKKINWKDGVKAIWTILRYGIKY